MKIILMAVGKTSERYIAEGVDRYMRRVAHYVGSEFVCLGDLKGNIEPERRKELEGEAILAALTDSDRIVLLDEHGKLMNSREFAGCINRTMVSGAKRLLFVIGGAYGFSDAVYARADWKLSLSPMTFPHDLVRLVFAEQLYRALTIMRGEKYHHD